MIKNLQDIVNTQININRAVWAGNLTGKDIKKSSFKNEKDRDDYVRRCLNEAGRDLIKAINNGKRSIRS